MTAQASLVTDLEAVDDFDSSSATTASSSIPPNLDSPPYSPRLSSIERPTTIEVGKRSGAKHSFPSNKINEIWREERHFVMKKRKLEMPSKSPTKSPTKCNEPMKVFRRVDEEAKRERHDTKQALKASLETYEKEVHTRRLLMAASVRPPQKSRQSLLFSLKDFKLLWKQVEDELGATTEEIENGSMVREANNNDRSASGTKEVFSSYQSRAQYGRLLFSGMQQVIGMTKLTRDDVFLDIGHGIGNAVLQAAFVVGCESRGIEVVPERCRVAEQFQEILLESVEHLSSREKVKRKIGKLELREGSLTDKNHREFMIEADVVLVNNANDIFGTRSGGTEGKPTLDTYVAGLFAMMKPNTRMVALHPILCLGTSLSEENDRRRKSGLEESLDASFFTCEKRSLGKGVVNWSYKEVTVFLYTRVRQSSEDGTALFLCGNSKCSWEGNPSAAVNGDGFLQEACVYCGTRRSLAPRS